MLLFFEAIVINVVIAGYGFLAKKIFRFEYDEDLHFQEQIFFGIIFLTYLSLLINIFAPISSGISYCIILTGIFFFFQYLKIVFFKKIIKLIFISSSIIFFLLIKSKVYDDYALYYLPSITKITESNIILGLSNIHFRFGHNFSLFYGMAIFKNDLLKHSWSLLILSLIYANFVIYLIYNIFSFKKKSYSSLSSSLSLFLLIIILIRYYDFGGHGLDVPASIFSFWVILIFIKIYDSNQTFNYLIFSKIAFISFFVITLKLSHLFIFILSIIIFLKFWKNIIISKKKKLFFLSLPFIIWIITNILISSCFIYPKKEFCLSTPWSAPEKNWISSPDEVFTELSAWSKGWIDSVPNRGANLNFKSREEYVQHQKSFLNGNWLEGYRFHFVNHVLKFFIILLIILSIYFLIFRKNLIIINTKQKFVLKILALYSSISLAYWFFSAPLLRFGFSFIILFFFVVFCLLLNKLFVFNEKKIKYLIFFLFFIFFLRNLNFSRDNNFNDNFLRPYPNTYSKSHYKFSPSYTKVSFEYGNLYVTDGRECFDLPSPCTQFSNIELSRIKIVKRGIFKSIEIK